MLGLGIDLVSVERMARALGNPRFAPRVFTVQEMARFTVTQNTYDAQRPAGVFAAKEAAAKALGTGFTGGITLRDIEIIRADGAPCCVLHNAALKRLQAMGGTRIMISITHEKTVASAVAVVL